MTDSLVVFTNSKFQISPDFLGEKNKTCHWLKNSSRFEIRKFYRLSKIINRVIQL